MGLYEIITRGVKQNYFEFCENQIRLYYRSSTKLKADSTNVTQVLNSKLEELVDGINKINDNLNNSNKDLKKEIVSELKIVGKSIKNLEKQVSYYTKSQNNDDTSLIWPGFVDVLAH